MHFKRLSILLICLIFIISPIAGDVFCYADSTEWQDCDTLQLQTQAFMAYCKSRDLTIEGSVLDAVTSFTTKAYQDALRGCGLDQNTIQANIKYATDDNGGLKFLFNVTGAAGMNMIFGQFLQDHDLSVGDSYPNDNPYIVYQGKFDEDSKSLVWIVDSAYSSVNSQYGTSDFYVYRGNFFYYDGDGLATISDNNANLRYDLTLPIDQNNTFKCSINYSSYQGGYYYTTKYQSGSNSRQVKGSYSEYSTAYGDQSGLILYYDQHADKFGYGCYNYFYNTETSYMEGFSTYGTIDKNNNDLVNTTINITTNNKTINNNNYEGDTIINNNGDIINNPDQPAGGTPPNWDIGGGDGTASDGDGNTWNIHFPDFELPDLNIDWSINGLGDKFPFSIPFDMVALITALSAEPEAPAFEGTIDFGFTTWDYDIDLSEFDSVASACRIAELILLVFGLILITRQIIKG